MTEVNNLGTITILKDGKEVECDILFTFRNDNFKKQYVGYTDHSIDANGRKNIYVNAYDPNQGFGNLEDITNQEELKMIQKVLEKLANSI
mgnify:CR=1 FL=1